MPPAPRLMFWRWPRRCKIEAGRYSLSASAAYGRCVKSSLMLMVSLRWSRLAVDRSPMIRFGWPRPIGIIASMDMSPFAPAG